MAGQRLADMTVDDLKVLIAEVVTAQLNQWFGKSASPLQPLRNNLSSAVAHRPYVNSDGVYILPTRTPEEIAARAKALTDLFCEWDREGDPAEQRETLEYLEQALGEDLLSEHPLSLSK
jgi:hypothetical protein